MAAGLLALLLAGTLIGAADALPRGDYPRHDPGYGYRRGAGYADYGGYVPYGYRGYAPYGAYTPYAGYDVYDEAGASYRDGGYDGYYRGGYGGYIVDDW